MTPQSAIAVLDNVLLACVVALMTALAVALAPRRWRGVGPLGLLLAFLFAFAVVTVGHRSGFNSWLDGVLESFGYQLDEIATWAPAFGGALVALGVLAAIRVRRSRRGGRRRRAPRPR